MVTPEPDVDRRPEETEACVVYRPCTCKHCGEKAEWRDCLVCDSCEEMYHIYCTNIPNKQIPPTTWYCTACTDNGALSLHENCVLCEKLHSPGTRILNEKDSLSSSKAKEYDWPEKWSTTQCHICRTDVNEGEDFRICTHGDCPHSRYHVKCLTSKQLNSYGSRWYCPSCLCRACLCDRDDEKIILCDACDYAYHIYCLDPPQDTIPTGKWFCKKCDVGVKRIREAREAFEKKLKKEERERVPSKVVKKRKRGSGPLEKPFLHVKIPDYLLEKSQTKEGEMKQVLYKKPLKFVVEQREEDGLDKSIGKRERVPSKVIKKRKRGSGPLEKPWLHVNIPDYLLENNQKKKGEMKQQVPYKKHLKFIEEQREMKQVLYKHVEKPLKFVEERREEEGLDKSIGKEKPFKPVEEQREEDRLDKSVGVDMLLTAAKTLEEDLGVAPEKS